MSVAPGERPPTAERRAELVRAGRGQFLRGERIDVGALCAQVGVGRATLYRWFGDRDGLVGAVLWSLADDTFTATLARRPGPGAGPLVAAFVELLVTIAGHDAFRRFLERDPGRALVLLTGRDSAVAGGLRRRLAVLVVERCPEAVGPDLPADELAYALVRLAEGYVYADLIAGRPVDVAQAAPLFERLLRR
jgi:AcrR family transcriptional regulator